MKILKKSDHITFISNNPDSLSTSELSKSYTTESFWSCKELNIMELIYHISYIAGSTGNDDFHIDYQRKLNLMCQIDDIDNAAMTIIKIKQEMNNAIPLFLQQHVVQFDLLKFEPIVYPEMGIQQEKSSIRYAQNLYR